jgi:hypothetical protein
MGLKQLQRIAITTSGASTFPTPVCCVAHEFVAAKNISRDFDCCAKQGALNF